jgi:cytochrome c-type biogenesis protein CcmH
MIFWLAAAALAALVTAGLVLPALRVRAQSASRAEYDMNVYKDQLSELERDAAEGRIKDAELDAARIEIERRLLAAAEDAERLPQAASSDGRWPLYTAAIAVPLIAVLVYSELGSPGVPNYPLAERTDIQPPEAGLEEGAPLTEMVRALEERLRTNPDDLRGWTLLGRTYAAIGRSREAAAAFERAVPLSGGDPGLLADWAEARLLARGSDFTVEIFNDFVKARERDPSLPKPWFYIGLDKAMGGDFRGAAQLWTDLLTIATDDAGIKESVEAQIARAAAEGGFDVSELKPSETALKIAAGRPAQPTMDSQSSGPVAPGPTREQMEAAGEMTPEERMAFIRSMVERLANKLAENPDDVAGWERLVRAYGVLGETDKAVAAQAQLDALRAKQNQ